MTARKPTGVNHEPGLAYLADTETVRHTVEFKAWERFNIDSYKNIIRCLRELAERDKNFEVVFATDEALKRRKWADIDVDAEKYRLKAWGTNLLKQGPAQRADQIMDFVDRGYLEKEAAFDAIDAPDMKALMGDRNVMKKNVEKRLKSVVRGPYDERLMPTPYIDLNMAKRLGMQALNKLELNDESEDKQERVVKFLQDVDIQLAKLAPPPPPPGPGGPPLPPGVTQAPPPIT
jgi:predicted ribonuclease YlaK